MLLSLNKFSAQAHPHLVALLPNGSSLISLVWNREVEDCSSNWVLGNFATLFGQKTSMDEQIVNSAFSVLKHHS